MRNKRPVLTCMIILLTVVFYYNVEAQQKNVTHRTKFSGEWKTKEPISIGGNIFCSYLEGDRMNSKTMKIAEDANFFTIENPNSDPSATSTISQEKLIIDGKESQINHGQGNRKKFTLTFSADRETITIKSVVYFMNGTPFNPNVKKQAYTNVTEVWRLSNDGKSITIKSIAKSNIWDGERSWKTVFYKTN
jgi:antitoxin component YwqK of YwqJK toxin-antitoxin module